MEQKTMKLDMDIEKALLEDSAFQEGVGTYERMSEQAQSVAEEMTAALSSLIIKTNADGSKANDFTLSTALLATAKTLINLSSYMYDTEQEYKDIIIEARRAVIETVIPALLNPQPCEVCPECKSDKPCSNPTMDTKLLQTRTLPLVSAILIEYDMWNKVMYMKTVHQEKIAEDKAKTQEE